jgi:hypothetical protein
MTSNRVPTTPWGVGTTRNIAPENAGLASPPNARLNERVRDGRRGAQEGCSDGRFLLDRRGGDGVRDDGGPRRRRGHLRERHGARSHERRRSAANAVALVRGVDGILVSESNASARFNSADQTTQEGMYWPEIAASVVRDARAFRDRLADPARLAAYKALLPSDAQGDGQVVIHSASRARGTRRARVSGSPRRRVRSERGSLPRHIPRSASSTCHTCRACTDWQHRTSNRPRTWARRGPRSSTADPQRTGSCRHTLRTSRR